MTRTLGQGVRSGNIDQVFDILSQAAKVSGADFLPDDWSVNGRLVGRESDIRQCLQLALDRGLRFGDCGMTSLASVLCYYPEIAPMLLLHGAPPNVCDDYGRTALHRMATVGYKTGAQILIEAGAEVNVEDNEGKTPLDFAVSARNHGLVAFLQSRGAAHVGSLRSPTVVDLRLYQPDADSQSGVILWFCTASGHGYLADLTETRLYFPGKQLLCSASFCEEGQPVTFQVSEDAVGPLAVNVRASA